MPDGAGTARPIESGRGRRGPRPIIVADNLGIRFRKGQKRSRRVRQMLLTGRSGAEAGQFWALRAVSFKIMPGEAVGVIGRNGSGKSTLLRMIAGVMVPDEGKVRVRAGVAPMIAVTGGFVGDLTVRDNIWLASQLHGLSRRQVAERFDGIVEWAEIGDRLDAPFRHLSSGMKAKIGFSVITSMDRPIVLIDEVLSVGDRAFRARCFDRLQDMLSGGKTLFLVSHSEGQIKRFCERALYMQRGRLVADGPVEEIVDRYIADSGPGKAS